VKAARTASGIQVQLTGYDNTRSTGEILFTFFDAAGNALTPGGIRVDASVDFARYFTASDLGGLFTVKADFPVTGDASRITGVEVQISNGVGSTRSQRIGI
jgi:hypothetical protein